MEQNHIVTEQTLGNFKQYLIEEERSKATIEKYIRDIKHFSAFLGKDNEITREKVLDYKNELIKEYRASSVNSMLAALNQFLNYIGAHTFKVKRLKVQNTAFREEKQEISKNDYKELVGKAYADGKERLALIMETICSTGIRVSELKYFTVKSVKNGKIQVNNKGKVRAVLIPEKLRKKLLYYISKLRISFGSIFITSGGKVVDRSNIWREMKKLGIDTGVLEEKIYPHNLRHLFAQIYYQTYKDLLGLADILGHSSIDTTRIYTVATGAEYRRRLEGLSLVM